MENFKKQVREFSKVVDLLTKHYDTDVLKVISTLIQNLGFSSKGVTDYSLEEDRLKTESILKVLKSIDAYEKNNHFISYIVTEVDMLYFGYTYEED